MPDGFGPPDGAGANRDFPEGAGACLTNWPNPMILLLFFGECKLTPVLNTRMTMDASKQAVKLRQTYKRDIRHARPHIPAATKKALHRAARRNLKNADREAARCEEGGYVDAVVRPN